jgi:hypothetical protein
MTFQRQVPSSACSGAIEASKADKYEYNWDPLITGTAPTAFTLDTKVIRSCLRFSPFFLPTRLSSALLTRRVRPLVALLPLSAPSMALLVTVCVK